VLPNIASARQLGRVRSGRLWIARSTKGGVCLLDFDPSQSPHPAYAHRVIAECGRRSELGKGIVALNRESGGRDLTTVLGVAPDAVRRVFVHFSDGAVTAVSAPHNFYSLTTNRAVRAITFFGMDGTPITAIKIGVSP
jgi:hypothetical protein